MAGRISLSMIFLSINFRHCEERSDEANPFFPCRPYGLLRCARNDGLSQVQGGDDEVDGP
jgi:hypothetical protein